MTHKDFWNKATIGVIGGGSWGTVLANLCSLNCRELRVWLRDEDSVRTINATRTRPQYFPDLKLNEKVHAYSDLERFFEGNFQAIIWALPSSVTRQKARELSRYFRGDELILHATKGIEPGSMKRISQILSEELPCRRIGVISGPNLAQEVAKGEPAATVVASDFNEVCDAGQELLTNPLFRVYRSSDMIGVEWAGTLKNILAIATGAADALQLGWNSRALLMTRGLAEMVRFGVSLGGEQATFLGLAGIGDLMATCSSSLSRNYRVGVGLGKGTPLKDVLADLGSTAEGVGTARSVWQFAQERQIAMPLTEGVNRVLNGEDIIEVMRHLMSRPQIAE